MREEAPMLNRNSSVGIEDSWLESIRKRRTELEKLIKQKESAISGAPDGHLRIQDRKTHAAYFWRKDAGDTNGKFLPQKKKKIAVALAQKDYDRKLVANARKKLALITEYLDFMEKNDRLDLYNRLSVRRKELVIPYLLPDEQFVAHWLAQPYEPMEFAADAAEYYACSGLRVRSKSEIIIADMLEKYKIPFKYECPLRIATKGTVRPDFTCLNVRTRTEFIWEHFGMMDSAEYACKNIPKIIAYEGSGYCEGKNLILTYETSQTPINANVVKTKIVQNLI